MVDTFQSRQPQKQGGESEFYPPIPLSTPPSLPPLSPLTPSSPCHTLYDIRRRQANLQKGKALLKEGRKSEAMDCFQKSVDVSPEMALALIKVI